MRVDLWGNEVYCSAGKKGRPPFEWTEENSNKVSMLLAMGWTNDRIAACVLDPRTGKPISLPTLKRHFRAELSIRDVARDQLVARQLMQAMEQADKGNVGAMRFFDKLVEKNDMMIADAFVGRKSGDKDAVVAKPGKKEIDQQVALAADEELALALEQEARGGRQH